MRVRLEKFVWKDFANIFKEDSDFIYKILIPCNIYGKYDKFDPSQLI